MARWTGWTIYAIAFAIAACSGKEKAQPSQAASDTAATMDMAQPADADGDAADRGKAAATGQPDTAAAARAGKKAAAKPAAGEADRGPTGAEAMGAVRTGTPTAAPRAASAPAPRELSKDQVKRLQAALNSDGCDAGTADGVFGAGTRRAIACSLKKHKLASNDYAGLYRSLNLSF